MASSVIGAIVRAVLFWVFFYIALAHCYVYWNWNATDGSAAVGVDHQSQASILPIEVKNEPEPQFNFTEGELEELLSVTPLERVELIDINSDPVPEELSPVEDKRLELREEMDEAGNSLKATHDEIKRLKQQISALEQANKELTSATDDMKGKINSSESGVWEEVVSIKKVWEDMMPSFSRGRRRSQAAANLGLFLEEVADLSSLKTITELNEKFDEMISALDKQVTFAHETSWQEMTQVLRGDYPSKHIEQELRNPRSVCSDIPDVQSDGTIDYNNAPTEDYVLEEIDEIRRMWYESYEENEVPLILPGGRESLLQFRDQLIERWAQKAEEKAKQILEEKISELSEPDLEKKAADKKKQQDQQRQTKIPGSCIRISQAESLIEAGLQAVERKQDLRRAILTAMSFEGIDTSKVILDAILEDEEDAAFLAAAAMSENMDEMHFTWRQVLDRPLTKSVTQSWLPFFLDVIGGYNDHLDQWLDQKVPVEALASGKTLSDILDFAGQYPLPPTVQKWFLSQPAKTV